MRLLDLYCGAGGAAYGYHQAGFTDIIGVDITPQPNYPFTFIQADALNPPVDLLEFDLIHASPPCQRYSVATANPENHPDLVDPTRRLLQESGVPYVIENVPGSPLHADLILCGSMFGLQIQRHRWFELGGFTMMGPGGCNHKAWINGRPWEVAGHAAGHNASQDGHRKYKDAAHARELMGMPWTTTTHEVTEAIPPAYTQYIGEAFLQQQAHVR